MPPRPDKIPPITQNLVVGQSDSYAYLNTDASRIEVLVCDESIITSGTIRTFVENSGPLGVAVGLHYEDQSILSLSICSGLETTKASGSRHRCLIIEFPTLLGRRSTRAKQTFDSKQVHSMIQSVLCRSVAGLYAFDLAPLALALYHDLDLRVTAGVDVQSACPEAVVRTPIAILSELIGKSTDVSLGSQKVIKGIFEDNTYQRNSTSLARSRTNIVQQAWLAQFLAGFAEEQFNTVPKIDTTAAKFSDKKLDILAKWAGDAIRLHLLKPLETEHDVDAISDESDGLRVQSKIYKSKLRPEQDISVRIQHENGFFTLPGATGDVEGRSAAISVFREMSNANAQVSGKIISKGRDGPTRAESKKASFILHTLQGKADPFSNNPWITNLWDPPNGLMVWPERPDLHSQPISVPEVPKLPLNPSQIFAIEKMLSSEDEDKIILIRGPPGTGKTSVISQFVEIATSYPHIPGIWLVAQSNVAVKNIAEKLASVGCMDWRLLVSKDFHFDWHEHLYGSQIKAKLIQSDEFFKMTPFKISGLGCKVFLCTLSMLSNFFIPKFTRAAPIHTLVVDEASQIEIGAFLPVLDSAARSLQKICLIGDDKQLPPHGQEDIQDLKSVFELEHLGKHLYLLDTQYRMPPQMGNFISNEVYDSLLKSNPQHPIKNNINACRLVDVPGIEEMKNTSYINSAEASAVVKLSAYLQNIKKSYRVITPYDSQRNYIESLLQKEELNWHDKCFNVDSFQGNEDDYIIISVVRSVKKGFLSNLRRTNVMLTRFRRGVFIVTSRKFVLGPGADTLVGSMVKYLEKKVGPEIWLDMKEVEEEKLVVV